MGSGQSKFGYSNHRGEWIDSSQQSEELHRRSKDEYNKGNFHRAANWAKLASEEAFRGGDHERGTELLDFAKELSSYAEWAKAASVVNNLVTEK